MKILYCLSLFLESCKYFIFEESKFFNLQVNLARFVQLFIIVAFFLTILFKKKINFSFKSFSIKQRSLFPLFFSFCLSFLILLAKYSFFCFENYIFLIRGVLDFISINFSFLYFLMPISIMLENKNFQPVFYSIIKVLFYAFLIFGFFEYMTNIFGFWYLSKHYIGTDYGYVGDRYHSLFGEPRDAYVYMLSLFGILCILKKEIYNKNNYVLCIFVVLALLATQSFSGLIGSVCAIVLYSFFKNSIFKKVLLIICAAALVVFCICLVPRFSFYFLGIANQIKEVPFYEIKVLENQLNNIIPLMEMVRLQKEFSFLFIFFGNGPGSSSEIIFDFSKNVFLVEESILPATHAFLPKLMYEYGIVGTILFIRTAFLFMKNKNNKNSLLDWLVLFSFLFHKNNLFFVYLGTKIGVKNSK